MKGWLPSAENGEAEASPVVGAGIYDATAKVEDLDRLAGGQS